MWIVLITNFIGARGFQQLKFVSPLQVNFVVETMIEFSSLTTKQVYIAWTYYKKKKKNCI
jgi:hypothetical protein